VCSSAELLLPRPVKRPTRLASLLLTNGFMQSGGIQKEGNGARQGSPAHGTPADGKMACGRCGGFLVVEKGYEEAAIVAIAGMITTRCVNCGNLEDPLIRLNRAVRFLSERSVRNAEDISEAIPDPVIRQSL
jgi:hypothetical protein